MTSLTRPSERLANAALEIRLTTPKSTLRQRSVLPPGQVWTAPDWREVSLAFDPVAFQQEAATNGVSVAAKEFPGTNACPVDYDAGRGWHRVDLNDVTPIPPPGAPEKQNDDMERVKLVLSNLSPQAQVARLLFEKRAAGFRHAFGQAITGISAMLRDADGFPTGIPVQLSKNWHTQPGGGVYFGPWFHGFSQVRLPPRTTVELELVLTYGHWGGVAAASHAQLCLIGWGSNQLWDESALGAWGESICYEPDQAQGGCAILDVRPVMVRSMSANGQWGWTHNVGGGDFFRLFDAAGKRMYPARMRTAYERQGPCLTEVTYAGHSTDALEHSATVSLARTDDLVRGIYRLRLDVRKPFNFSRFVIFQLGADTYNYSAERKMALGNETGLVREWATQWGGDSYRTPAMECKGRMPWISLHDAEFRGPKPGEGAWANRGFVIRSWQARLGGKPAAPWVAEHGVNARGTNTSTADLLPPPGLKRLEPGDYVEAIIEHLIVPQFAADYYGPNEALRTALGQEGNTWRMIHREAVGNDRSVEVKTGKLERLYPAISVRAEKNRAEIALGGGLGYVPITFSGLTSWRDFALFLDNQRVDQSVHGKDFWQTDFDPTTQRWSLTFNLPLQAGQRHAVRLNPAP
jgi:hypothetical protein